MADLIPPRRDEPLTVDGISTQRFAEYLEGVARQSDVTTTVISAAAISSVHNLLFSLENRLGSGDSLTSDETGFTVDLDTLTVDMDEA